MRAVPRPPRDRPHPHLARRHPLRPWTAAWAEAFTAAYGYELAGWDHYPPLSRMRDLVQLTGPLRCTHPGTVFEDVVRQRLAGIWARDTGVALRDGGPPR